MRTRSPLFSLAVSILLAAVPCTAVHAQTDVALSMYGAFSGTTNSNSVQESPANAAGAMIELRHIRGPLIGYEATYSFNRANQKYIYTGFVGCPAPGPCPIPAVAISADAHEVTGAWVISGHAGRLRPFALAGAGVLINQALSSGDTSSIQSNTTAVYVYGAGIDWKVLPHIGLRLQYRGNVHKVPELSDGIFSIDALRHTAEPMIGAYFRF